MFYRRAGTLLLAWFIVVGFALPVSADMGPKPSLTIKVYHPPEETYYLDLLVPEKDLGDFEQYYEEPDEEKLTLLQEYSQDEWKPILTLGSHIPVFGDLEGRRRGDGTMVHRFDYFGIPDNFKIIIITPDNQIRVSQQLTRQAFDTVFHYDYLDDGVEDTSGLYPQNSRAEPEQTAITVQEENVVCALLRQMVSLPATLLIEGILLLVFGFSLRKNWKAFLLVNLITQALLVLSTGMVMYYFGVAPAVLVLILMECFIIAGESVVYSRVLQGHTEERRAFYGFVANVISAAASYLLLYLLAH